MKAKRYIGKEEYELLSSGKTVTPLSRHFPLYAFPLNGEYEESDFSTIAWYIDNDYYYIVTLDLPDETIISFGLYNIDELHRQLDIAKEFPLPFKVYEGNPDTDINDSDHYIVPEARFREYSMSNVIDITPIARQDETMLESVNQAEGISDEEILEAIDNQFGQKNVYMWSTYVLPNGHFLNPEKNNELSDFELAYEHEDFDNWIYDNFGQRGIELLQEHTIKMNVTYPYLHLPNNKVTPDQVAAIKQIISNKDGFEYAVHDIASRSRSTNKNVYDMAEPLLVETNSDNIIFDLRIHSATYIVKTIVQYYQLKRFLKESIRQLQGKFTYKDQDYTEIYDLYDLRHEGLPAMIAEAELLQENNWSRQVIIDYPNDGIWNLNGNVGKASFYAEAGKKAFVRGGQYVHPEKGWSSFIAYMTAYEYIVACAKLFSRNGKRVTPEQLIKQRVGDYDLDLVFGESVGQIFYPVLDIKGQGQEGLHRAIWFMMSYDEEPMPVIIIE